MKRGGGHLSYGGCTVQAVGMHELAESQQRLHYHVVRVSRVLYGLLQTFVGDSKEIRES